MLGKRLGWLGIALLLVAGQAGAAGSDEDGFFMFLDAAMVTPGETDQVLGYARTLGGPSQVTTQIGMDWDDGSGASLGAGYSWGSSSISVSYWQFDDDTVNAFEGPSGGYTNFAIGPASYIYYGGLYLPIYVLGAPGSGDFISEIDASVIDLTYDHTHTLSDYIDFEWSVGVRFASFEERLDGVYDICGSTACEVPYYPFFGPDDVTFDVAKSNEGDMGGVRVGFGGSYFVTPQFAISSKLAFSALMGDVTSASGLTPTGSINGVDPPTFAFVEDDDRTGTIRDIDVALNWYLVEGRLRLALGYRHSLWDGIAADLVRNPPGLLTANKEREHVTFSGATLGVRYQF